MNPAPSILAAIEEIDSAIQDMEMPPLEARAQLHKALDRWKKWLDLVAEQARNDMTRAGE